LALVDSGLFTDGVGLTSSKPHAPGKRVNCYRFFEETIGTWMCQPQSKLQGFDFEEKRKRRFSFFMPSENPGEVFRVPTCLTAFRTGLQISRIQPQDSVGQ
jgi:hypothetical protein